MTVCTKSELKLSTGLANVSKTLTFLYLFMQNTFPTHLRLAVPKKGQTHSGLEKQNAN